LYSNKEKKVLTNDIDAMKIACLEKESHGKIGMTVTWAPFPASIPCVLKRVREGGIPKSPLSKNNFLGSQTAFNSSCNIFFVYWFCSHLHPKRRSGIQDQTFINGSAKISECFRR